MLTQEDQLFILGDLIDRGRNSALVLDFLLDLISQQYQIYPIRGNHEEKFLMAYGCGFDFLEEYLRAYNSMDLLSGDLDKHLGFIASFEYCIELDHFILSHSGINVDGGSPSNDLRGMFSNVKFMLDWEVVSKKTQIHGHNTVSLKQIEGDIRIGKKRISIDAGCVYKRPETGVLIGLDLDSKVLYKQKNIE